jgi:hypothetical protein
LYEMKNNHRPGNVIAEYSLIACLIISVSITVIAGVGVSLKGWASSLNMLMAQKISASKTANAAIASRMAAFQLAASKKQLTVSLNGNAPSAAATSSVPPLQPYSALQTVGANGINIVDQYSERMAQLAKKLGNNPNVNPDFIAMIQDLAADGHNVAGDERSVLTYTQSSDGNFAFTIQSRYAATKARALNYLASHSTQLSPEDTQVLQTAANNITQQITDFIGTSNSSSLSALNINKKFTDKGSSGQGATYVDNQAVKICNTAHPCP